MKTTIALLILLLAPIAAQAQFVDENFEEWVERNNRVMPEGWIGSSFGLGMAEGNTGNYALAVWNWYSYATGYAIIGRDKQHPLGWSDIEGTGAPIDFVPLKLTGYYRYVLGENRGRGDEAADSAVVFIAMKTYDENEGKARAISTVEVHLGPSDTYIPFSIDIPETPFDIPADSIVISFASSINGYCGPDSSNCCYFYVDDIALQATSGISYPVKNIDNTAYIYPNPVTDNGIIELGGEPGGARRIRIVDAAGNIVLALEDVRTSRLELPVAGFGSGAYYVTVQDETGEIHTTSRFIVQ